MPRTDALRCLKWEDDLKEKEKKSTGKVMVWACKTEKCRYRFDLGEDMTVVRVHVCPVNLLIASNCTSCSQHLLNIDFECFGQISRS